MKIQHLLGAVVLTSTFVVNAEFGGTDGAPWKASADIVNSTTPSGITVVDSSYAACATQFQNAMDSHAYYHGYVFTNIQYCSYKPAGVHLHHELADALAADLATLEDSHNITEYLAKKKSILKTYQDSIEELPAVPPRRRAVEQ